MHEHTLEDHILAQVKIISGMMDVMSEVLPSNQDNIPMAYELEAHMNGMSVGEALDYKDKELKDRITSMIVGHTRKVYELGLKHARESSA